MNCPLEEDESAQKEIKDNIKDQEKYFAKNASEYYNHLFLLCMPKFSNVNTALNRHPYTDEHLQPPKAV